MPKANRVHSTAKLNAPITPRVERFLSTLACREVSTDLGRGRRLMGKAATPNRAVRTAGNGLSRSARLHRH
jgi:hypothetical protein